MFKSPRISTGDLKTHLVQEKVRNDHFVLLMAAELILLQILPEEAADAILGVTSVHIGSLADILVHFQPNSSPQIGMVQLTTTLTTI